MLTVAPWENAVRTRTKPEHFIPLVLASRDRGCCHGYLRSNVVCCSPLRSRHILRSLRRTLRIRVLRTLVHRTHARRTRSLDFRAQRTPRVRGQGHRSRRRGSIPRGGTATATTSSVRWRECVCVRYACNFFFRQSVYTCESWEYTLRRHSNSHFTCERARVCESGMRVVRVRLSACVC